MRINKSWCKTLVWFSNIFHTFLWHSTRFPRFNPSSVTKILIYFLAGINTKEFWNILKEKYFAPLRIMSWFINYFANPFFDTALTCFDSLFNSFLFYVTSFSLLSKSFFLTKLTIALLPAKFYRFNLKANISAVNLLNFEVVIYLSWLWPVMFFSILLTFVL